MVELMRQQKDRSGQEIKTYIYNGYRIEELPYFLYEVTICKYWKWGFCVLGNQFYKSNKLLHLKKTGIFKEYKDYVISKDITLIGAPYDFIKKLPECKSKVKKKKCKKH